MVEQHTPEPWWVKREGMKHGAIYIVIGTDEHSEIARCYGSASVARRIVACVNACAGLDTEKLEQGVGALAEFLPEWCIEEESR